MIDGVYFITVYWLLIVPALAVFIVVLSTELHGATTTSVSLQVKAVLFGASVVDVVSLLLIGLTILDGWHIGVEDETTEYCASISCPGFFVAILSVLFVFIVVWLRQVFLLKDAKPVVEQLALENIDFAENRCLEAIINGPPNCFIILLLAGLFMTVLAIHSGIIESYPDEFTFCITEPHVHLPTVSTCFVYLTILWALVTVMTTNILKQQRLRYDYDILFSIFDTVDNNKPSLLRDKIPNSDKVQTYSQLPLFLAMSSVWLPPVHCLSMIAVLNLDAITKATVVFMTMVYCCLIATLSLILCVFFCSSLWAYNQIIAENVVSTVGYHHRG